MPQIVATASAQLNSNLQCSAASATFEVTTNLAGSMGVGLPHLDPAAKAYEACMAMKETINANPAAQGLNCLSKAVLKFDVNSAMGDACHAMRSALPSIPSMRWDWTVGTTKLFSKDYAQQACTGTQAATTNQAVAKAGAGEPASLCDGGWQRGDGTGGSERYIGHAANFDACVTMVKGNAQCTSANGATMPTGGSGSCYCEFSMTGRNSAWSWSSCKFSGALLQEEEKVVEEEEEARATRSMPSPDGEVEEEARETRHVLPKCAFDCPKDADGNYLSPTCEEFRSTYLNGCAAECSEAEKEFYENEFCKPVSGAFLQEEGLARQ